MEPLTQAVWTFLEKAGDKGILDEVLSLAGGMMPGDADLTELLGRLEDSLSAADFSSFEDFSREVLAPGLEALSSDEALDGLRAVLFTLRPVLEKVLAQTDGDSGKLLAGLRGVAQSIGTMKPVATALFPVVVRACGPSLARRLRENAVPVITQAVNAGAVAICRNPETVTRFIDDVFAAVDGQAFREATDRVVGALLDQRPPLVGWTASTMARRARMRVLGSRQGGNLDSSRKWPAGIGRAEGLAGIFEAIAPFDRIKPSREQRTT